MNARHYHIDPSIPIKISERRAAIHARRSNKLGLKRASLINKQKVLLTRRAVREPLRVVLNISVGGKDVFPSIFVYVNPTTTPVAERQIHLSQMTCICRFHEQSVS